MESLPVISNSEKFEKIGKQGYCKVSYWGETDEGKYKFSVQEFMTVHQQTLALDLKYKEFSQKISLIQAHEKIHPSWIPKSGVIKIKDYMKEAQSKIATK